MSQLHVAPSCPRYVPIRSPVSENHSVGCLSARRGRQLAAGGRGAGGGRDGPGEEETGRGRPGGGGGWLAGGGSPPPEEERGEGGGREGGGGDPVRGGGGPLAQETKTSPSWLYLMNVSGRSWPLRSRGLMLLLWLSLPAARRALATAWRRSLQLLVSAAREPLAAGCAGARRGGAGAGGGSGRTAELWGRRRVPPPRSAPPRAARGPPRLAVAHLSLCLPPPAPLPERTVRARRSLSLDSGGRCGGGEERAPAAPSWGRVPSALVASPAGLESRSNKWAVERGRAVQRKSMGLSKASAQERKMDNGGGSHPAARVPPGRLVTPSHLAAPLPFSDRQPWRGRAPEVLSSGQSCLGAHNSGRGRGRGASPPAAAPPPPPSEGPGGPAPAPARRRPAGLWEAAVPPPSPPPPSTPPWPRLPRGGRLSVSTVTATPAAPRTSSPPLRWRRSTP